MNTLMLRRRAMMQVSSGSLPDTSPELVYTPNKCISRIDGIQDYAGSGVTDFLPVVRGDVFVYHNPASSVANSNGLLGNVIVYNGNKSSVDWWNCRCNGTNGSFTCDRFNGKGYARLNIPMDGIKDCYAYNNTTGVIYYAGINTPYYGKTNIND